MPELHLKDRSTAVFGLKGTGKSNLVQYLLTRGRYQAHLMYDVCREHQRLNTYTAEYRHDEGDDEAREELNTVTERMVTGQVRDMRPEVYAVEEMSRFCSPQKAPPPAVYDLLDLARHYGVGVLALARRPAQVHNSVTEMADNLIFFRLTGSSDYNALNKIVDGLGDVVRSLDDYEFAWLTPDRRVYVYSPVPEMETTGRL
jgi:hypothetical protein